MLQSTLRPPGPRARRQDDRGFTLVELMVTLIGAGS